MLRCLAKTGIVYEAQEIKGRGRGPPPELEAMMKQYTPPSNREVKARLLSTAGWIEASFLIPAKRSLTDYSNQQHDFFKLKDATLPGLKEPIPFFALQRQSVILMLPEEAEEGVEGTIGGSKEHKDVSCAIDQGVVSGTLCVSSGLRMSDFMIKPQPFFYLKDCTLFLRSVGGPQITRDISMIIINRHKIVGVSEPRFV